MMSDASRKDRIEDEVIVDCYDEYEVAMGWFYYLNDNLIFPFKASIVGDIKISSLQEGDSVTVIELIKGNCYLIHEFYYFSYFHKLLLLNL